MSTFIETWLGKQASTVTFAEVESFISQRVKENLNLEYKSLELLDNPDKISIAASSFGNSAGGLLILGVPENSKTHLPDRVEWSENPKHTGEQLEQILTSGIHPRIDGLTIVPVRKGAGVVFLVDIPAGSNPPYMAGDYRYYKRLNFQKTPMEAYDVSDLFGKRRRPVLGLTASVEPANEFYNVTIRVTNRGKALAKDIFVLMAIQGCEINSLDGFTRQGPGLITRYSSAPDIQPVYPHPSMEMKIGVVSIRVTDPTIPVKLDYELISEESPLVRGQFVLTGLSIPPNPNATVNKSSEAPVLW
jgi:hypothetical protein